jgi:hypothetical protein
MPVSHGTDRCLMKQVPLYSLMVAWKVQVAIGSRPLSAVRRVAELNAACPPPQHSYEDIGATCIFNCSALAALLSSLFLLHIAVESGGCKIACCCPRYCCSVPTAFDCSPRRTR